MSHSSGKSKRGPFGIYWHTFSCKISKNSKGDDPFGTLKNFGKKSHSAEKNQKGDPFVSSGFVGYLKKVKNEEGDPLDWPDLALGIFSKKWTDQWGLWSEKKGHCYSRAFFFKRKTRQLKTLTRKGQISCDSVVTKGQWKNGTTNILVNFQCELLKTTWKFPQKPYIFI